MAASNPLPLDEGFYKVQSSLLQRASEELRKVVYDGIPDKDEEVYERLIDKVECVKSRRA